MKILGRMIKVIMIMMIMMFSAMWLYTTKDAQIDYDVDTTGLAIPTYETVELDHNQSHADATSLPFTAGTAIDLDGDGVQELFIGGGHEQADVMYKFSNGNFTAIPEAGGVNKAADASTTLSGLAFDTDQDGDEDLIVTRPDGIWLYENDAGKLSGVLLTAEMLEDTTPLSVAVADINNDGHFDMYISGYIRNDLVEGLNVFREGYGGTSALLINSGDNRNFANETEARGLLYKHNTFQSAFVDFEKDGDLDLVVAHDTGQVRTWINDGNGNFTNQTNPNSSVYSYPMGIGIADYDNNGFVDFLFSNVGSTPPHFMVAGDLTEDQQHHWKWIMLSNKGDGTFDDTAEAIKIADYEFGWGPVFEDLNLDGREDAVVSQNFVSAPFHKIPFMRLPGRLFIQTENNEFAEVGAEAGVVNKRYSIAPVTADFNGDGASDIVHINVAGKSQAFLSQGAANGNGYLKVKMPRDISSIGAMVEITLEDGTVLYKPYVSGEGLVSDSSNIIIAGLGSQKATSVEVKYLDGSNKVMSGSYRDETIVVEK